MKNCARIILVYVSLITVSGIAAQPCMLETGALYGTTDGNESAYVLADSPDGTGFYVGGFKDDSTLIVKMDYEGLILWSRTFDVVPGKEENLRCMIFDSDENLVFGGITGSPTDGGTIFLVKFDPGGDNIIWANELVTGWTKNFLFDLREKSPGGNYVLSTNPHNDPGSVNNAEILEITRSNGNVITSASKMFTHGNSQQLFRFKIHGGSIFAVGRYTEGASFAGMRNTVTRLNANTYAADWTRMGHVGPSGTARLYGQDLFILNDEIYSSYHGDPAGTSLTNTNVYVQKTDLNGNLLWLKQYDFPGNNDFSFDMIDADGGIVMLGMKRSAPTEIIMMKMNYSGAVLWANTYKFDDVSNVDLYYYGQQMLIEAGGYLIFSALGSIPSGGSEMIIVRTDLDGNVITPCVTVLPISVPVINVSNPVFYAITPGTPSAPMTEEEQYPEPVIGAIQPTEYCGMVDTIFAFVSAIICEGEFYEGYSIPGTYIDYFTTQDGCDSVRTLELDNYPPSDSDEQITICLGQSYAGYTATGVYPEIHTDVFGCDSIYTLDLTVTALETEVDVTICSGQEYQGYTESGFYVDTIQGPPLDCDTVQLLTLTVTTLPETTVLATICEDESYEGYSVSGTYVDDFVTGEGCDSIRTLVLTVTDVFDTSIDAMICEGQSYEGYSVSGTYVDYYISGQGCDSIRTLVLTVIHEIETSIDAMICEGESFEGYTQAGIYTDNFISVFGCDSIRTLTLSVNPDDQTAVTVTVCDGQSYEGYSIAGIYEDAFTNVNGCDSFRTLTLMVNDTIRTAFTVGLCEGETYEGYSAPGVFTDTYTATAGCDSIRTVTLIEVVPTQLLDIQLCAGLEYDGYSATGSYVDTLPGANGACDTVRYLDLMIDPPLLTFINAAICEGDAFMGYTQSGLYTDTFVSIDGCDSVRMIQLTIQNTLTATEQVTICEGESYQGYSIAGTYIDTFVTSLGCDSVRLLELFVDMPQIALEATICEGSSYLGYTTSGVFTDVLPGNQGDCDTVRTLTLLVTDVLMSFIDASVCEGEQFEGYFTSGAYVDTFISNGGCDSVRTLILTVDEIAITSLDHSICLGEMYEGYNTEGVFVDTFQTSTGCDSVRTLNLTVGIIEQEIQATICNGQSYETYTLPGVYVDTISAMAGLCDTLRTLNLSVTNIARTTIDQVICDGDTYAGYSQTGIYIDTLTSPEGCDSIRELNLVKLDAIKSETSSSSCDPNGLFNLPTGIHIDTLISARGCDSVRTIVVEGASLYIPNVFTPNDDGINDAFTITAFPALDLDLDYFAIFDRFGDMVYETVSWPVAWKGDDASGDLFQSGVFAYVLIYYCGDQKQVEHGNITLVK